MYLFFQRNLVFSKSFKRVKQIACPVIKEFIYIVSKFAAEHTTLSNTAR